MTDTDDSDSIGNLFICEDYLEKIWHFGDLSQTLLCSNMSATSHDLTGQIVWPAAIVLSHFISGNQNIFRNKIVFELGAGAGLAGFISAQISYKTIITDGNEVVLRLLNRNKLFCGYNNTICDKLIWNRIEDIESIIDTHGIPDVIIGADVILWPNFVKDLLCTLRLLLIANKIRTSVAYISYVLRAQSTSNLLFTTAALLGLVIEDIPLTSFIPVDIQGSLEISNKYLLKISINQSISEEEVATYLGQLPLQDSNTVSSPY